LILIFNEFLHFLEAEFYQTKFVAPKLAKMAFLQLLDYPKFISHKIPELFTLCAAATQYLENCISSKIVI